MRWESGAPELTIQVFEDPDLYVVRLIGEFDVASAEKVDSILRDCERRARSTVLVDLEDLDFIDSTGLKTLLEAKRRAEGDGLFLRATGCRGAVARLLEVTGVDGELVLPASGNGGPRWFANLD
ncbi:MAG TPA: STAS domain-containing protein [Solirubrobacterales bacterium]|jgi:anti-anti-sigma factor